MLFQSRYAHSTDCYVKMQQYRNGRPCMSIVDNVTGEVVCVASVNLPDHRMDSSCIAIKDYSENENVLDECVRLGLVSKPIYRVDSGFVSIPICTLLYKEPT